jgi:PAS domain S-box-containing protein
MGGGISALHYTAMAAMRLQGTAHYSPALVTLSVVIAIVLSVLALWLAFLVRDNATSGIALTAGSVLLWGAANPAMHYSAMAAVTFFRSPVAPDLSHAVSIHSLGVVGISIVPAMVLAVSILTSVVDRIQKQRVLIDELFEQTPQALVLTNADNRVVRINREFTRVFGYSSQEAVGCLVRELIVPEELWDEAQRYAELVAQGQRVEAEVVRRHKNGTRLVVSVLGVPVAAPSGQIVEKLATYCFNDITERKRAEEEIQRSRDKLRALAARLQHVREEERTKLAREIHDELGSALTAIKIHLSSVVHHLPPDKKQEYEPILEKVDETVQSVRRIATELRPAVLDALGLVAAIEWAAEEFEARTGTKCRLELPPDDVVIDPERATAIFRIFQETLTNVARHAGATQVNVRLIQQNRGLVLEVHDNGKGITEQQLSASSSLGILGMRERALLLGGELSIKGEPGEGTTVTVRIPESLSTPREDNK